MTRQLKTISGNLPMIASTFFQTASRRLNPLINSVRLMTGLRSRYIVTRKNMLRLRYALPTFVLLTMGGIHIIGNSINSSQAHIPAASLKLAQELNNLSPAAGPFIQDIQQPAPQLVTNTTEKQPKPSIKTALKQAPREETHSKPSNLLIPASFYKRSELQKNKKETLTLKIESGETITGRLKQAGLKAEETYNAVKALSKHFNPRSVRAGQSFMLQLERKQNAEGKEFKSLSKMTLPVSAAKEVIVYRSDNGAFQSEKIEKDIRTKMAARKATLKYSLYGSAAKAGIPDEVIANMIKIFSWDVDFQRDIRSGDQIEILYEVRYTDDGTVIGYGDILFARLNTGGRDIPLYRYVMKNGRVDYYAPDGQSIRKTLMRTPVDGARMSSGYGMRRHPILGYNKLHKGADFAAPTGTPIYAAGDGVIEKAGRWGSYGNYVRIRHNSKLKTAYAHMHKIKSGIRPGARVEQGQVIGTVGSTGRSTGPHLHYEVLINNKQVNPQGVNVPSGEQLKGHELRKFKNEIHKYDLEFAALTKGTEYASASKTSKNTN